MELVDAGLSTIFKRDKTDSYEIPKYQRGYSWGAENIEEFWQDLIEIDEQESLEHFFGIIYTRKGNSNSLRIIDGQQRITTSAIFLICVRDYLYTIKYQSPRIEKFYEVIQEILYMTDKQHNLDTETFLLTLSRTNKDFFNAQIVPEKKINTQNNIKDKAGNDSNEYLADAYTKLLKLIDEKFTKDESGAIKLNHLMWSLLEKFRIMETIVSDDIQAYKLFNLINNRGIQLAESDLIKNLLFGELDEKFVGCDDYELQLDDYDLKWADIRDNITGHENGDYQLDKFFHNYLIATKADNVKLRDIFSKFKKLLEEGEQPTKIIRELLDWSNTFVMLRNPEPQFDRCNATIHYLKKIKNMKANYIYSVLMAGYQHYWEKDNKNTFDTLVKICFKYHIRVKSLGMGITLENYQSKLYDIVKTIKKEDSSLKTVIGELAEDENSYPSNSTLELQLKTLQVTNSNLAVALLEEIERTYDAEKLSGHDVSVEHIMPKSDKHWKSYILEKHANIYPDLEDSKKIKMIYDKNYALLGNQTLLSDSKNKRISNKLFDEKRKIYKNDGYKITNELANESEWTESTIKSRQLQLQKKLLKILDLKKLDLN